MADTNSQHAHTAHTESDGVNYRGIVVFVVILAITTIVCELIVVGTYKLFDRQSRSVAVERAPLAAPSLTQPPAPNLLTDEPGNLQRFRAKEEQELTTYGWVDKSTETVRLPIERAKQLVLERGFPTRDAAAPRVEVKKADAPKEVKK